MPFCIKYLYARRIFNGGASKYYAELRLIRGLREPHVSREVLVVLAELRGGC